MKNNIEKTKCEICVHGNVTVLPEVCELCLFSEKYRKTAVLACNQHENMYNEGSSQIEPGGFPLSKG